MLWLTDAIGGYRCIILNEVVQSCPKFGMNFSTVHYRQIRRLCVFFFGIQYVSGESIMFAAALYTISRWSVHRKSSHHVDSEFVGRKHFSGGKKVLPSVAIGSARAI